MSLHLFKPTFVSFGNVLSFPLMDLRISKHPYRIIFLLTIFLVPPPLDFTTICSFVYTKATDHNILIFYLHNSG